MQSKERLEKWVEIYSIPKKHKHKGNTVSVGSGFSIEDRNHYYNNPNDIVGKEITVQYFEESTDKTGKHSLRFPVCKTVYEAGIRQI